MRDLKLAFRTLFRAPVVTGVAILSLALGIGSNAAIFSLFNQILLRPLPVEDPARLVNLEAPGPKPGSDSCNQAGGCDEVFSYPMYLDLRREQTVFTDVAAHCIFEVNVAHGGATTNGQGVQVSGSYFGTLGLVPALGRLPGPEVDEPIGGHPIAVLSHDFWVSHFGADPGVLDEVVRVNGHPMTVVGVAPAGFRGTTLGVRPLVFVPIVMRSALTTWFEGFDDRRSYWAYLFARLKPGLSIEEARAGLEPLYRGILSEVEAPLQVNMSEQTLAQFVSKPIPIRDGRRGQSGMDEDAEGPLVLLLGATAVIVLIACANIANLLLARSAARAQEMAVRLSIGASRWQLLRQLLTESCLLAALGGVAALAVAGWTLASIGTLLPPDGATDLQLALDAEVAGFTLLLSLATGLLFGIFPALHNTRNELVTTLKDQAGQPSGARAAARFRNGLVTAQIALSMALLVSAGLFIRSLVNVSRVDLGIETENVVTFELSPVLSGYDDERSRALYERVEAELAAQPGVTESSSAMVAVFGGSSWGNSVMVEGFEAGPDTNRNTRLNRIAPGYFRTLGIPLLAGRDFTAFDTKETAKVAIVNRAFAGKFGLGNDAVGRRMGRGGLDAELDTEIVGLVEDTLYNDVKGVEPPLLYMPHRQEDWVGFLTFYARSAVEPDALLRAIPPLVARIDPELPVERLKTLPQQVRENVFLDRMITILSSAFAGVATLLAAVGLYGVLAYTVAQRTREIGLRMALGADATRLRRMVLGQVGRMALVGGGVGLAAAVALGRMAGSLLYGIEGMPVGVVGAAVLGVAAVALAAGFVPAHRASRIDPMVALRDQ